MCGTYSYQAPEIGLPSKDGYQPSVDSWSLGVMVFFMLVAPSPLARLLVLNVLICLL